MFADAADAADAANAGGRRFDSFAGQLPSSVRSDDSWTRPSDQG